MHPSLGLLVSPLALAGIVLIAGFLVTRLTYRASPVAHFLCQLASFAGFTAMLKMAKVSPFTPAAMLGSSLTDATVTVFKVVWWLAASWLLAGFVRAALVFQRQPKETRFLQDLFAGIIYIGAVLGIIADVFNMPVSGLLAASGVIAIVLGLALQSTLGDVFSGVVLNLAKPFRPGDWVILDKGLPGRLEGRVIETNWRATQLLLLSNDLATIPNSIISKAKLVNSSAPTHHHGLTLVIRLDPVVAPSSSVGMLETALLSCTRILRTPRAVVMIRSLDAVALECELLFFVATIDDAPGAQNEVFDRVHRHCASAGIRIAPPADSAVALPPRDPALEPADIPRTLLERLPVFLALSSDERLQLAPKMRRRTFKSGDVIAEQGVVTSALYILVSGVLVALQQHDGTDAEILRYAPGDCFGQASVLTGALALFKVKALTRAVVYEIATVDLAPILKARPAIAVELGQVLAAREAAGKSRLSELDGSVPHDHDLATRLAHRVKTMFGLEP